MPSATTTTTLDIRVNARDLNRLDQKLKAIFGPARTREFTRGVAGSERALGSLTRATQRLTDELTKQRRASTDHFSRMEQDAKDARREVERLRMEVERLSAGGGGGAAGGGGGGGRGPGRPGGYGGAPQLGVPDASSIATAMAAIPFIGMAAGGATMASYQMYGSALGYQTARRDTFASLGPQGAAMLRLRMTQRPQAERTVFHGDADGVLAAGLAGAGEASGFGGAGVAAAHRVYSGFDRYVYDTGASRAIRGAVGRSAAAAGYQVETIPGRSAEYNAPLSTADLERIGMSYGMKPGDALREAAGLSSAMGRRSTAETYDFARAAQTYFGVDAGTTGGIMRGMRNVAGLTDQQDQADAVAQLIGKAVARGLEGSEIGEHMSQMAGYLRKQADMGQQDQAAAGLGIVAAADRLGRSGLRGDFASAYAFRLGEGASQMGYGGGADPVKFGLLQQLGFGKNGRYDAESYADAMLKLQDPDQAAVAGMGFLSSMGGQMRGAGMGAATRALLMSRMSGLMGAQFGPDVSRRLAEGIADPTSSRSRTTAADITGIHREAGGTSVGILAGEAGMEAGRIQAGYKAASQVQAFNAIMVNLANTVQNVAGPALDLLTGKLERMSAAAASWEPGSGVGSAGGR